MASKPPKSAMRNASPVSALLLGILIIPLIMLALAGFGLYIIWAYVDAVGWSWGLLGLLLIGPIGVWAIAMGIWCAGKFPADTVLDLIKGAIQISGAVSGKSQVEDEGSLSYRIQVQGQDFQIKESIYDWVSEGEEVTVRYWPRINIVVEVRKKLLKAFP